MIMFLSRMQTHRVFYQAALSKTASVLWKCCRSTEARNQFYSGKRTGGETWKGECLSWTLKNWLGFS